MITSLDDPAGRAASWPRPLPIAIALFLLLPAAEGALAQRQLEETLVTAQKREESVQDVPISITVVGAEELAVLNIFDFTETASLTPGVEFFPSVQAAAIRLRGVGPGSFALTSPQSVAMFIDDIAQGSVGAAFATLVDVERIELLRGPQGTLYGQNAPGGAYNITTRAPNPNEFEGYVEGTYTQQEDNSDLEGVDVRGALNLPLVDDTLAVRIAGVYADSDGYIEVKNPLSGESSTGGKEHVAARARMLWIIDERSELVWTSNYADLEDHPEDFNIDGNVPGTGGANPVPAIDNELEDNYYYGDFITDAQTDLVDTAIHYRRSTDITNIDVLASWQDFDTWMLDNREPYPNRTARFDIQLDWETTTAELRFSDTGDRFDYIGGFYYALRDIDGFFDVDLSGTRLSGPAIGEGDVKAAYVNFTWHLAQQWDFTAGARYDKNDVWTESDFSFLIFNSVVDATDDWEHPSWSLKLRYFHDANTTAYLAIDNAYKQGGFNNLIPGLLALENIFPITGDIADEMLMFDEEVSTAFEVGVKGTALDSRLSYSVAVFYQEFEDHQIAQPTEVEALKTGLGDLNALMAAQLTNAEEVVTQGVETELFYLLGKRWDLGFRFAWFDAYVEEWTYRFCAGGEEDSPNQLLCPADSGDALNNLPPFNTNTQLGYTRPLSGGWGFYGRLNWTWRSEPNGGIQFEQYKTDQNVFDLTLGMNSPARGLDLRLWGKNLTEQDRNVDPGRRTDGTEGFEQPFGGRYFPGRQYGLTVNYQF
jgi:iron complex outermembrane receptor protein